MLLFWIHSICFKYVAYITIHFYLFILIIQCIFFHLYITPIFEACIKLFPHGELHCLFKQFQIGHLLSLPLQSQITITHLNSSHLLISISLIQIVVIVQLIVQNSIMHPKLGFEVSLVTWSKNIFTFSCNDHLTVQIKFTIDSLLSIIYSTAFSLLVSYFSLVNMHAFMFLMIVVLFQASLYISQLFYSQVLYYR